MVVLPRLEKIVDMHALVFSFVRGDGTPEKFGKDLSIFCNWYWFSQWTCFCNIYFHDISVHNISVHNQYMHEGPKL